MRWVRHARAGTGRAEKDRVGFSLGGPFSSGRSCTDMVSPTPVRIHRSPSERIDDDRVTPRGPHHGRARRRCCFAYGYPWGAVQWHILVMQPGDLTASCAVDAAGQRMPPPPGHFQHR